MILVYVISVLIAVYYVIFHYRNRKFRKLLKQCGNKTIPSLPVIGIAHHFIGNNQTRMKAFQMFGEETNKNGGLVAGWFGPFPYLGTIPEWTAVCGRQSELDRRPQTAVITDPVAAEVVLKECLDKDYVMKLVRNVIGNGLIVAPLSVWRFRRRILVPTFISKNLKEFVSIFAKQSHVMAQQLRKNVGKGPFPIWNYLAANNMDTVCEAVFGVRMNVQQNNNHPFLVHFNETTRLMAARLCQPWLHSNTIYKLLPQYKRLEEGKKVLYDTVDDIIKQKHIEDDQNKNRKDGMRPFLDLLIESSAQENAPYNDQALREETLTLTIAGTDTSAAGAAFVLLAMSEHQDVQEKVYQEIKSVLGESTENVTMDDLRKLEYMEAAIKEAMRLNTPVPVILRRVTHDVTLPSGLVIPAGCGILMNIWGLHRNQKYWGEDADEFRPERFLDTPFKHPAQYMAFSYGPRNCPGGRYAMLTMKTALATLLNQYRILPGSGEPRLSFELMMKDADDFRVQLELRNPKNGVK